MHEELIARLRRGAAPLDDPDLNDEAADALEAMQADARRLDWIESQWQDAIHIEVCATNDGLTVHGLRPVVSVYLRNYESRFRYSDLRKALDEAMALSKAPPPSDLDAATK